MSNILGKKYKLSFSTPTYTESENYVMISCGNESPNSFVEFNIADTEIVENINKT